MQTTGVIKQQNYRTVRNIAIGFYFNALNIASEHHSTRILSPSTTDYTPLILMCPVSSIMLINKNYSLNSHQDLRWGGLYAITVTYQLSTEQSATQAQYAVLLLTRHTAGRITSTNTLPPETNCSPQLIPTINHRTNPH